MKEAFRKYHECEVMLVKTDKTIYLGKIMVVSENTIKIKVYDKFENPTYEAVCPAILDIMENKDKYSNCKIKRIRKKDVQSMTGIEELVDENSLSNQWE